MLFDRSVDPITPLFSQGTFIGRIDEEIGISLDRIEISEKVMPSIEENEKKKSADTKKLKLDSKNEFLKQILDINYNFAHNEITKKWQEIKLALRDNSVELGQKRKSIEQRKLLEILGYLSVYILNQFSSPKFRKKIEIEQVRKNSIVYAFK